MTLARSSERERVPVSGISISHPRRVIYPDQGLTKLDVARYYDAVVRAHAAARRGAPADAAALRGRDRPRRRQGRLHDAQARQGLGNQRRSGACRFASCERPVNTWSPIRGQRSSASRRWASSRSTPGIRGPKRPTCTTASSSISIRGRRSRGTDVIDAAGLVRQALADVRLRSSVKTTGGKGLHVVAPVEPTDVAACLAFARDLAAALVRHAPAQFTTANAKVGRERRS